jgi:multiple sugar transport system substrate-binding protein
MTRKLICVGLIVMMLTAISACTGQTQVTGEKPKGPVKLVYMTTWEDKKEYNNYVLEAGKKFAEKYPDLCSGVELLPVTYSGYEAKFKTSLGSGTYVCDIFQGQLQTYHDYADPMPKDFAEQIDSKVVSYLKDIGMYKGVRYGIPQEAGNFQQLYINVDMFEAAGLDPDTPPKTFAELKEMAKKLTQYDESGNIKVAGFGIRYSGEGQGIADKNLCIVHSFGGKMFDAESYKADGFANSAETIEAVTWLKSLLDEKITNLQIGVPETAFGQGVAAMIMRESWVVGYLQNNAPNINFKVYPIPAVKKEVGAGNLFPWSHMVYKDSPNKEVAWKFLQFLYEDTQYDLDMNISAGYLPVLAENYNTDYVKSRPDYNSVQTVLQRNYTPCYSYYIEEMTQLSASFGNGILKVLYDEASPKDAMDQAAKEMDEILQKAKK